MSKKKSKIVYVGKFIHYRLHSEADGSILSRGGATASILEKDGKTYAAVAYCNPSDNFNFQYGRAKADGRLTRLLDNTGLADDDKYFVREGTAADFVRALDSFMSTDMGYFSRGRAR